MLFQKIRQCGHIPDKPEKMRTNTIIEDCFALNKDILKFLDVLELQFNSLQFISKYGQSLVYEKMCFSGSNQDLSSVTWLL